MQSVAAAINPSRWLPDEPASPENGKTYSVLRAGDAWDSWDAQPKHELKLFESPGVSTTTATAWSDKITGTTDTYGLIVRYGWNYDRTTNDIRSQLLLDGASNETSGFDLHRHEPNDDAGNIAGTGTNQAHASTM
ncbi:hypothetical protein [Crateriforma conspicua]|uniref:hypothetical protein n=1 Tax=Crateriforma conspicua TaxID=2527996 RepID=UPI00118AFC97|nr:hypothetical protein [Crateriforma conspicua]QDV63780.1 hypothetical protein Mal65_29260 [Crateriforma conspicua]